MALSISQIQPSGVAATYFVIREVRINVQNQFCIASVDGYLDLAAFQNGLDPLVSTDVNFPSQIYRQMAGVSNLLTPLYTLLSQMPPFAGASVI